MGGHAADWRPGGNPGFHLNLVARRLTRFFDRRLAALGVNVAYLPVLGALHGSASLSQKELARIGHIGQPAMAQMLERMVAEGLLLRAPDPADGRKVLFSLSRKAAGMAAALRTCLSEGNADVFGVLTDEELAGLMATLRKIDSRLEALLEESAP